jgi:hypothetical protein
VTSAPASDPFFDGADIAPVPTSAVTATTAWFLFGGATIVLGAAVAAGLLARAVLLDVVALWPIGGLALLVAPLAWWLRRRVPLLSTVVPLLLLTWLLAGVGWFLADGIGDPPSRAADIVGPDERPAIGAVEVSVDGVLLVDDVAGVDYRVATATTGGSTPAPEAFEALDGDALGVVVRERADGGWYGSSGWRLGLRAGPAWTLDLTADEIDADLKAVTLDSVALAGDGRVELPAGGGAVSVASGTLTLVVPDGIPTSVSGPAETPAGWVDAGDTARLAITVAGGSVTVEVAP